MATRIISLIPAPKSLMMKFRADPEIPGDLCVMEPPVCLALVERGTEQSVVAMEISDGEIMVSTENPRFMEIVWVPNDSH